MKIFTFGITPFSRLADLTVAIRAVVVLLLLLLVFKCILLLLGDRLVDVRAPSRS